METKKVVFITGCSSGIGKALCYEYHRRGYRVIATTRRLQALEDLHSIGIVTEQLDVTNAEEIDRVISDIVRREGKIDILINNAGYGCIGPLIDIPENEIELQFQTNVFAPLEIIKRVVPSMRQNKAGCIVNIGSISGIVATPFAGVYCASKAAIHVFSDALRMELAPFGIRVITIQPGGIQSEFGKTANSTANRLLKSDSWYTPIRNDIFKRSQESQVRATPAYLLAKKNSKMHGAKKITFCLQDGQ